MPSASAVAAATSATHADREGRFRYRVTMTWVRPGTATAGASLSRRATGPASMVADTFSAVMVVLPCYLHDYKAFHRITIMGEVLAISCVIMCLLFIFVDMGQPQRVLNVALHPTFAPLNRCLEEDWFLLPFELQLQRAHTRTLEAAGILSAAEHELLCEALYARWISRSPTW